MNTRKLLIAVVAAGAALGHAWANAHGGRSAEEEEVTPVQIQKLPDVPGKQVIMAVVSYKPGQASAPHSHSGSVLAYVLEGEIVSQLAGQEPVTYKAGETWFEPPRAGHLVSRNASNVRPAKLLAFLLTDEGGTVKEPLPK